MPLKLPPHLIIRNSLQKTRL